MTQEDNQPDPILELPWNQSAVVVAGPGCGKSWRIAERVKRLTDAGDLQPSEITVVSLTRSTAHALQAAIPQATVSTLHGFSLRHLNSLGDAPHMRVVDPWEQTTLVSQDMRLLLPETTLTAKNVKDFFRRLGAGFSQYQTEGPELTPIEQQLREKWLFLRDFMRFRLFDELAYDLLRHLDSGTTLLSPPKLVMVDEYQDLTPCELRLLKRLAEVHGVSVFACGDDRQSIFGFRAADPLALNNFCREYELEGPFFLNVTHRCPALVCEFAEAIAAQIPPVPGLTDRPPLTPIDGAPMGAVRIKTLLSTIAEARWVHDEITSLMEGGSGSDQIMVIVPSHVDVYVKFLNRAAEESGHETRYHDSRSADPALETREFRCLYALARLGANQNDHLAWRAIVHFAHGFGAAFVLRTFAQIATTFSASIRGLGGLDERVASLVGSVDAAATSMREAGSWDAVLETARQWINDQCSGDPPTWDAVSALPEISELLETEPDEGTDRLSVLLSALYAASRRIRGDAAPAENEVQVRTVHQAKGLQADHVFVMFATIAPFLDGGLESGDGVRRLYVAATRARRSLYITLGRSIRARNNPLSRRLGTISVELSHHVAEAAATCGIPIET